MRAMALSFVVLALALFAVACGEEAPDPGDGKYHPAANGVHTTETLACNALVDAHGKALLALGCVGTSRTCPGYLRTQFAENCLEYDQGSVNGCVDYFKARTTCEELNAALDGCVITSYPGTAPKGCP